MNNVDDREDIRDGLEPEPRAGFPSGWGRRQHKHHVEHRLEHIWRDPEYAESFGAYVSDSYPTAKAHHAWEASLTFWSLLRVYCAAFLNHWARVRRARRSPT